MSRRLSGPEAGELLAGSPEMVLGYLARDGAPAAVPVWVHRDGEAFVFLTASESAKARAIRRDPRVSLCAHRGAPSAFVTVRGLAHITTEPAVVARWAAVSAAVHGPPGPPPPEGDRFERPADAVVRVTPRRVIAVGYD